MLDLGRQPSAEIFPDVGVDAATDARHSLRMWLCRECHLAQLMEDPGTVEEQTAVVEARAMLDQTEATLAFAAELGLLVPGTDVAEFGSPHWLGLEGRLRDLGVNPVPTDRPGSADLVVDVYGLLHDADQAAALALRATLLRPGGAMVFQLHTLASVIDLCEFSELRHGHFGYWSLPALDGALRRHGLGVHRARRFPLDGGTLAVAVTADPRPDPETETIAAAEREIGVGEAGALQALQHDADAVTGALRDWLGAERALGRRVIGYGAASRTVPILCHAGIDTSLLPAIADASPAKNGRRMPGTDIPIISPQEMLERRPDHVLLFLPDIIDEVRSALPGVEAAGAHWVILTPKPTVLDSL